MSITLIDAIYERGPQKATPRAVLQALAFYIKDECLHTDPTCFPSLNTLAKRCAMGRSTVVRAVEALEEEGWIETSAQTRTNGALTSNLYRLNIERLLPDTPSVKLTLAPSPDLTPPSTNLTLPPYQNDTTLVPDWYYPSPDLTPLDPVSYPGIDPGGEGEGARETEQPQPPTPAPPPRVKAKSQIPDRTPGGNGYRPPAEPKPTPRPPIPPEEVELVNALVDVTGLGGHLNADRLMPFARELLASDYTAEQVRLHFGRADPGPKTWWYWRDDWRGRETEKHRAEPPTIAVIRERISLAVNQASAASPPQARELTIMEKIGMLTGRRPADSTQPETQPA